MKLTHCIECGCHDLAACYDEKSDGPCSWLAVDREDGKGVCSACPEGLARWNAGDRSTAVPVDDDHFESAREASCPESTLVLGPRAIGTTRQGKSIIVDALIAAGAEDGDTVEIDRDGQARVIGRRPRVIVDNTK